MWDLSLPTVSSWVDWKHLPWAIKSETADEALHAQASKLAGTINQSTLSGSYPNIKITDVNHFSAYDIAKFKKIVFTESSIKELEKKYS